MAADKVLESQMQPMATHCPLAACFSSLAYTGVY